MTRIAQFIRGFPDHPAWVDETYFGHMRFALGFAGALLAAGGAALVHALIPPLFATTASRRVKALHARIHDRQ